jgi:hypothetical protein
MMGVTKKGRELQSYSYEGQLYIYSLGKAAAVKHTRITVVGNCIS